VRLSQITRLRCPACVARGEEAGLDLDPTRLGGGRDGGAAGDLLEGYLVCRRCRTPYPVVGGVAVLPREVHAHLERHANVWRRARVGDPRIARWILSHPPRGEDHVPFDEVVARYADLAPAKAGAPPPAMSAADDALDRALRAASARGPALEVGCGVGRGTFVIAARTGDAVGLDRSAARVRRARNVATADEFLLPVGDDEAPIDLARLRRDVVDHVVGDADALPFAAGSFATVVLHVRDGEGAWADASAVAFEARRVTAPEGLLLVERVAAVGVPAYEPERVGAAAAR
jgi:SAM-dependent methyltransferase